MFQVQKTEPGTYLIVSVEGNGPQDLNLLNGPFGLAIQNWDSASNYYILSKNLKTQQELIKRKTMLEYYSPCNLDH